MLHKLCADRIDEIRQVFKDWASNKMQQDTELGRKYEKIYNNQFNNYVPKRIPDDFVPEYFTGATHTIKLRTHQAKAAIRGTMQNLMLAHEVGSGKAFTLISTAMEMRRLGTAKKQMIVVQNATVGQFIASAKFLYPNAKILTLEDNERTREGRKAFYAKIKYNDWDMIVIPQSVLEKIPDSDERQVAFINDKIAEKEHVLEAMQEAGIDDKIMQCRAEKELEDLQAEKAAVVEVSNKKRDEKKAAVFLKIRPLQQSQSLQNIQAHLGGRKYDASPSYNLFPIQSHDAKVLLFFEYMYRVSTVLG